MQSLPNSERSRRVMFAVHWCHETHRSADMKYKPLGLWLLWCALPVAAAQTPGRVCTDPCLKAAIAALYIHSPFLSPFRIDISVENAVATLEGTVSDPGERALAGEIAAGLDGVSSVINRIRVAPPAGVTSAMAPLACAADDETLVDRVEAQLHWHRPTHGMKLQVSAEDGIVTLHGVAGDAQQAELARLIALNTCGVKQVVSRLTTGEP
jgi:osmotically-inducible protein OsmY